MKFLIQSQLHRLLLFISLLFTLSGCGIWDSFTTYFNLYYNARKTFEKAEEQIYTQRKDLFSTEALVVPGSANTDLTKVIEKCSKLLQFHSETGYVPDALLMLGKSFYYQKNYQKAERKFEELISGYPENSNLLDSKFWIAKCKMRLRDYNDALVILAEVRDEAVKEGEDEIIRDAFIEEIVYRITIEDLQGAVELANEFLQVSDDDEIKADVWFEVGNLNMKIGKIQEAVDAYSNVFEYSPDFDLEAKARLNYGKALRENNETDKSYGILEDMLSQDKYSANYAEIKFELGKTLHSLGRFDDAIDEFKDVDTTYKSTVYSGASKFEIGKIYEENLKNLDSAAQYYRTSSTSTLPPEYITEARQKNQLLGKYLSLRNNIQNYNKQLFYLQNPEAFVQDSIAYVQDSIAIEKELRNYQELQSIWGGLDSLLTQKDTTGFYSDTLKVIDSLIVVLDSLNFEMIEGDTTLIKDSVLVHIRNPLERDSTVVQLFDSMFVNREIDPVRKAKLLRDEEMRKQRQNQLFAELPDTLKFKNNPPRKSKLSIDSLGTLISKNELEVGNLFLTELNMPDSAYWYYNDILNNYPNTVYQATALYSLGSYYLTLDQKQRADSLFNIIYENYKNESIVNAAADKLKKPFIDLNYDPAFDDYHSAEVKLLDGKYSESADEFYNVFQNFPLSPYAPKALYSTGLILEDNLLLPDSAAAIYDTLAANYPTSEFVRMIAPKLTVYNQEQRKLKMEKQDSLYALEKSKLDSLHADSLNLGLLVQDLKSETDTIDVAFEEKLPAGDDANNVIEKIEKTDVVEKKALWNPRIRQ